MTHLPRIAGLALGLALLQGPLSPASRAESVLRMVPQADLRILDPVWTTATITFNHSRLIYDTLYSMDSELAPQPQMVESHSASADKLTWRFTLRPGLKFHDGSPVTSADVIQSLKRWIQRSPDGKIISERTASLEPDGERGFVLALKQSYGMVIESLAGAALMPFMMRKKDAETDAFTEMKESIGSGPYRFLREAWVPGSMVAYAKNKDYVPRSDPPDGASGGKVVKVDRVEWPYIPDPGTALAALQRGEVDMLEVITHDMIPILERDPNIALLIIDPIGFQATIRPNHLVPPFNNPKARQALFHIGTQQDYLAAMVGQDPKYQRVCFSPFICGSPNESKAGIETVQKPDRETAKRLLKEGGYGGQPIVVMTPTDQPLIHTMTLVTAQFLREVGATVDLQAMDWSTLLTRRVNKNDPATDRAGWNIAQTTWPGRIQQNPFTNLFASTSCDGRNSWGLPCDQEMERIRLSYIDATTQEERKRIIDALQRKFLEVVPYVPIGQFTRPIAYRKSLKGVVANSWDLALWNIEKTAN
ncbi:MAG: ABC transporter substrate-binding protein [Proteobacteria bacterium]|nr:ABC transporter substrate-binding protein [Pseudomonadota bacterium]MBI3497849.1 ABC transporter substrate-binding protein [Pseudomonadota bacterium]